MKSIGYARLHFQIICRWVRSVGVNTLDIAAVQYRDLFGSTALEKARAGSMGLPQTKQRGDSKSLYLPTRTARGLEPGLILQPKLRYSRSAQVVMVVGTNSILRVCIKEVRGSN
jgi:hypothetical protein